MKDPIVEEVRVVRMSHAQQFKFDLKAICANLKKKEKEYEQKYGHPIESLTPKTLQTVEESNASN